MAFGARLVPTRAAALQKPRSCYSRTSFQSIIEVLVVSPSASDTLSVLASAVTEADICEGVTFIIGVLLEGMISGM